MKIRLLTLNIIVISILSVTNCALASVNLKNAFLNNGSEPSSLRQMGEAAGYKPDGTLTGKISYIIEMFLGLLGVIFLVLLIYGGFLWMTARGSEQQVEKAKEVIFSAVIGLIIVVAAYAISIFVVTKLTESTLKPL